MGDDLQLRPPELRLPDVPQPLALPPLHEAETGWPRHTPLPVPWFMDRGAIERVYDRTMPRDLLTADPASPLPPPGIMCQIGLQDDPALTLGRQYQLRHTDWAVNPQLTLSLQGDNPNDTDNVNRLLERSPLGDTFDPTPSATQIPSQGSTPDTPPMSWTDLVHGVAGQPRPPDNTNVHMNVWPPAETMCRDQH